MRLFTMKNKSHNFALIALLLGVLGGSAVAAPVPGNESGTKGTGSAGKN